MSTTQGEHTPGPWAIADGNDYRVLAIECDSQRDLVKCTYICDTATNPKTRTRASAANAKLIAASPDLLAAAKAALDLLEETTLYRGPVVAQLRAAIVRAER